MVQRNWDTIVIGAGMGGLTAAVRLVKEGLCVLVLERNPHPGGTAYVYHRKGFTFPMGPLGFSNPILVQEILRDLGSGDDLDLCRVHYRIRGFDLDVPISLSFQEMVRMLTGLFPLSAKVLEQFFMHMEEIISSQKISDTGSHPSLLEKAAQSSASEYLQGLVHDRRLYRILGSLGTREPYSNLSLLAAMWNLMCEEGIWYPKQGMKSLCGRLAKAVTGHDGHEPFGGKQKKEGGAGEIRLSTEVAKIRVENGKAIGVILKDGTEIDSDSIISNADFKNTFIKLLGPDEVPFAWYQTVLEARQTGSILQVCLGIDAENADLSAFSEASRVIYRKNQEDVIKKELDWSAAEIDPEALVSQELEVSLWGPEDRMLTSERKAVIVIRTEAEHHHFSRYRLVSNGRSPEYQNYKARIGRGLIQELEHLVPGLQDAMLVIDVATPLTFEDQGGRSEGAVAGWSWDYEDFRDDQPKELIRTPIKGLYMAGHQAFSALFMGGVPTAMESGNRAARAVLQGTNPVDKIMLPGKRLFPI
jgi:all-trans-retinol 13,14-reductase